MSAFHVRLKNLREESGIPQFKIAEELGIAPQVFSNYINGREPNYDILIKIANYFNVSTDYLLGIDKYKNTDNIKSSVVIYNELFKDLSELNRADDFAKILGVIAGYYKILLDKKTNFNNDNESVLSEAAADIDSFYRVCDWWFLVLRRTVLTINNVNSKNTTFENFVKYYSEITREKQKIDSMIDNFLRQLINTVYKLINDRDLNENEREIMRTIRNSLYDIV
ncbi:MAG: helix-turn-helix domain-containing protein [Eubacteriales bacterium]